ncbi:MAG: hypothetical protein HQ518_14420 [Rhodopirellula sp.]|nr:hypothetical protein [Rhodopirellula sp.]
MTIGEKERPRQAGTQSPDDAWYRRFSETKFPQKDVVLAVGKLHAAGRHDENVALMKAALTTGQSQPWMYDVLPLSMKLAGRPQHEIDRAMLSRVDFTTTDVTSLLLSAARLGELGGKRLALDLYQQAAAIDPTRPEPYAVALKLARVEHDADATQWACSGILTHVWTRDFQTRHDGARDAAADIQQELFKAGKLKRLEEFKAAIAQAERRDLQIKVEWSGNGDLDLTVKEPLGTTCSLVQPKTASGGLHIHDGFGPRRENCYEEYICVEAASGLYELQIDHVDGTIVSKRCVVTVISHVGSAEKRVSRTVVSLDGSGAKVPFTLENGRRKQLAPTVGSKPAAQGSTRLSRQELIARVRQGAGPVAVGNAAGQGGVAPSGFRLPAGAFTAGVGFSPIVGFINEGVSLSANAVVSADRRFVRISVAPFFNTLREIQTFSFQGGSAASPGGGTGQ